MVLHMDLNCSMLVLEITSIQIITEQHGEETLKKLNSENELSRILGPLTSLPIATLRISPIGLVLKPNGGGVAINYKFVSPRR